MKVYENSLYKNDLEYISNLQLPWEKFQNKSIMISGATGLIGSMLIDVIMKKNQRGLICKIFALGSSEERMKNRFEYCYNNELFEFIEYDVNKKLIFNRENQIDYIFCRTQAS